MKKMLERYKNDRPREKLAQKGPLSLSDLELLQALIGSGNAQISVTEIAKEVLKLLRKDQMTYQNLKLIKGLGSAKISEILAAFELAKRHCVDSEQPIIDSSEKAVEQFSEIRNKKQEHLVCLTLDGANRLITKRTITIGTLTASLVHPREVFADAITDRAASIIIAHNHPSGNLTPSQADKDITKTIQQAGELLGIKLLDHIIVTTKEHKSLLSL